MAPRAYMLSSLTNIAVSPVVLACKVLPKLICDFFWFLKCRITCQTVLHSLVYLLVSILSSEMNHLVQISHLWHLRLGGRRNAESNTFPQHTSMAPAKLIFILLPNRIHGCKIKMLGTTPWEAVISSDKTLTRTNLRRSPLSYRCCYCLGLATCDGAIGWWGDLTRAKIRLSAFAMVGTVIRVSYEKMD